MDIWHISALSDDKPSTYIAYVSLSLYPHIYEYAYHIYSNHHCRGRSIESEEEPEEHRDDAPRCWAHSEANS